MREVTGDFLEAARVAAGLLRETAVADAWDRESALAEFGVGGLAGHLALQVLVVPQIFTAPVPEEPVIPLLEHYARIPWVGAALDDEVNVHIREGGERVAADGPKALVDQVDAAIEQLAGLLAGVDADAGDRPARFAFWGPWSLRLDDLLVTRTMELVVHSDDLAVSVGVPTPEFPGSAVERVVDLLSRLAVRRHGQVSVVRALSRAERAPRTITAF